MTTGKRYVYFVYADYGGGRIKIGCSVRPEERIRSVTEWIPVPCTLMATMEGSYNLEGGIHDMFAEEWSHGEWFRPSPRLLKFIEDVRAGRPVVVATRRLIPEGKRASIQAKKRWTRRLGKAESAAKYPGRPAEVAAIIAAYQRQNAPTPTPQQEVVLEAYIRSLEHRAGQDLAA